MKRRYLFILFIIGTVLNANDCKMGEWYVSQELKVDSWAGSVDVARNSSDWNEFGQWDFSERRDFSNKKSPVFGISEIIADEAYTQGIYVAGLANLRLNGQLVEPMMKSFFSLDLEKGTNTIELELAQLPETAKNRKVALSKVDLQYMDPSRDDILEAARLAINFLGETHASYEASKYLTKLDRLEKQNAPIEEIDKLRYEALVLNNPVVNFDQILFRDSKSSKFPSNWQGNSTYLRRGGKETQPSFDNSLQMLNLKDASMKTIYQPLDDREGVMDVCLDYSGEKFLYSGIDTETNTFQVYEMNLDGSGKRQITPYYSEIDNYNGIYLPNGKNMFCSTAS